MQGLNIKLFVLWSVGALAIIALADPYPDLATVLVVLLIAEALFSNLNTYLGIFSGDVKQATNKK